MLIVKIPLLTLLHLQHVREGLLFKKLWSEGRCVICISLVGKLWLLGWDLGKISWDWVEFSWQCCFFGAIMHVLDRLKRLKIQAKWILDWDNLSIICLPVTETGVLLCSKDRRIANSRRVNCLKKISLRIPRAWMQSKVFERQMQVSIAVYCASYSYVTFLSYFSQIFIAELLWKRLKKFNHIFRRGF